MTSRAVGLALAATLLSCVACAPVSTVVKRPLDHQGQLIIYLQPLRPDDHRIKFTVGPIAVVGADGQPGVSLRQELAEVGGAGSPGLQRRLAEGELAPGQYTGVTLQIQDATVSGEDGPAALLVPDDPVIVPLNFEIRRKQATVLLLRANLTGAVEDGFRFKPRFRLTPPEPVPEGLLGFASAPAQHRLWVFNKRTLDIVGVIPTAGGPRGLALSPQRGELHVALSGQDAVETYDVFSRRMREWVNLGLGDEPVDVALSPKGDWLVTANSGTDTASIIDATRSFERARLRVGRRPSSVVVSPDGRRAYVMSPSSQSISALNLERMGVDGEVTLAESPLRGLFNRGGDRLLVIASDSPNLLLIDPSTLVIEGRVFAGAAVRSLAVDSRSGLVYAGLKDGGIAIVDERVGTYIDTIETDSEVGWLTVDNEDGSLLAVCPATGVLKKFDLVSRQKVAEAAVDSGACAVVVMGAR